LRWRKSALHEEVFAMNGGARWIEMQLFVVACVGLATGLVTYGQSPAQSAAASGKATASSTPSADQILARYIEVEGGRAAWQKLTSRVSKGTIEVPSMNLSGTVEIHEKAPDRLLGVVTINGASFRQGFDGTVGWTDDPENGLREQSGAELAEARRDADFYHPMDLRKLYTKFTVTGKEKIGDRETYVVEGAVPEGGDPDIMYFDIQTGLPIRVVSQHHGPDGITKFVEDFEDFREVDGIKLPFTLHQTNGDTLLTITLDDVHHNVELDDGEFTKPAAQ
jgi:zinc protease